MLNSEMHGISPAFALSSGFIDVVSITVPTKNTAVLIAKNKQTRTTANCKIPAESGIEYTKYYYKPLVSLYIYSGYST